MRARYHVAVASSMALALAAATRSLPLALGSWVAGIFMDLDHLLEYLVQKGRLPTLEDLFHASYHRGYTKAYLVLHAWELAVAGAFLVPLVSCPWLTGAWLGFVVHLGLDQTFNRPHPWAYWILWRAAHGFSYDATFPPRRPRAPAH